MAKTHDFRKYGIIPEKGRPYENIAYVMALVYQTCEKRIARLLSKYKISPEQFNVLMVVRYQNDGGGMTQVDIGKHLIVSPGSITRLVDRLAKEKYLTVRQNARNRRENIVTMTEEGCNLIDFIWPHYDQTIKDMVSLIPENKHQELASLLADWFVKLQETQTHG